MKPFLPSVAILFFFTSFHKHEPSQWIRINQLGYVTKGTKVAVWCSKGNEIIKTFQLIDAQTNKIAFSSTAGKA
jgi:hypothetical protein